jgi:hypothetical protein
MKSAIDVSFSALARVTIRLRIGMPSVNIRIGPI